MLAELPVELRWTLLLVDVEGLDQIEPAQVLGITVGTAKSRIIEDGKCSALSWGPRGGARACPA
jgi:hypothetical protein